MTRTSALPTRPSAIAQPVAAPRIHWRLRPPQFLKATGALLLGVVLIGIVASGLIRPSPPPATVAPSEVTASLTARGKIVPVSQARVGTLSGGVVSRLAVEVGDEVNEQQEIARVRSAAGTEIITAPYAGTVTDILVHLGDTIAPAALVASVADLNRLQVETTDVDEFLIAHVEQGQTVHLTVDALDRLELAGLVRSVSIEPRTNATGDEHYLTIIDIGGASNLLRPGMTVRVDFTADR